MRRDNSSTTMIITLPVWMKSEMGAIGKDRGLTLSGMVRMLVREEIDASNEVHTIESIFGVAADWIAIRKNENGDGFNVFIDTDDSRISVESCINVSIDQLVDQRKLRTIIATMANRIIPHVPEKKWPGFLTRLFATSVREEKNRDVVAVQGADPAGMIAKKVILSGAETMVSLNCEKEFIDLEEEIIDGFVCSSTHIFFKLETLRREMHKRGGAVCFESKKAVGKLLRSIGAINEPKNIKGVTCRLWSVPISLTKEWRI